MVKLNWLLGLFALSSIAQLSAQSIEEGIRWPEAYEPTRSKFFVHNEIEIYAPPAIVWDILLPAETWPDWYEGAKNVVIVRGGEGGRLSSNAVFDWQTMGLKFRSTIKEFVPNERLSWESRKRSIQGYHAWLIVPTATGCRLITDESQHGWLTFFEKTFQPRKLHRLHDIWLSEIKKKAEAKIRS
jgi:uncharacterized protein YndB with AHSA1/START domain